MGSTERRFRREVVYVPLPSQRKFSLLSTRFKGFSGPVGSGKSEAFVQEALKLAYLNDGRTGLIGAPTFPSLRDSTQAAFFEALDKSSVPFEFTKHENRVVLPECGSTILFRSLDNFERLRGTNLAWFGVDELTYTKKGAWERLQARLRDPKAKLLCGFAAWTAKGFDWVYDDFIGPDKKAGYESVRASPFENRYLPPDYYENLKTSYDERFYKQEVLGEYLPMFSGQAYYTFDRKAHLKADLQFDPRFPLCWSMDFNIDPAASVLAQVIDTTTREQAMVGRKSSVIHILDEIVLPDTRTADVCPIFLERIQKRGWLKEGHTLSVEVYGDASGGNRHSSSRSTDWQQVREFFKLERNLSASFKVPSANPLVRDRVTAVNSMLRNADGDVRCFVDPQCKELTKDFEQVSWKRDNAGNALNDLAKQDPKRTHISDALGYLIWHHRPLRDAGGPRSRVII